MHGCKRILWQDLKWPNWVLFTLNSLSFLLHPCDFLPLSWNYHLLAWVSWSHEVSWSSLPLFCPTLIVTTLQVVWTISVQLWIVCAAVHKCLVWLPREYPYETPALPRHAVALQLKNPPGPSWPCLWLCQLLLNVSLSDAKTETWWSVTGTCSSLVHFSSPDDVSCSSYNEWNPLFSYQCVSWTTTVPAVKPLLLLSCLGNMSPKQCRLRPVDNPASNHGNFLPFNTCSSSLDEVLVCVLTPILGDLLICSMDLTMPSAPLSLLLQRERDVRC